jgi:NAD(P)-dependent dehydrogenase (short-subunit alcohol dehydrogenase family)
VATSTHQGNVGSSEDCRRTVAAVVGRHGRLDILVNNAGIASDEAVLNLTNEDWYRVIAVKLSGITVNAVTPGYTDTEMVGAVPEKVLDRIKAQIPLGRLGRPEEIARVVHFLAADASSYITGQVWGVNGGIDM